MKYAQKLFPKGTLPSQKTDGAYLNTFLSQNLNILARRITDDMHFMGVIAGNDGVGNGKTTLATHVGAYLTNKINELHGLNIEFTAKNMVFKGADLVKISFELPKYSVIVLDESDDLKQHSMKATSQKLKKYFRKCRQLNQILILITPGFFELPKFYALARSHFLINVKFKEDFQRGSFDFYGNGKKKALYIRGKKNWDYTVTSPDFYGAFTKGYVFFPEIEKNVEIYKYNKYLDTVNDADDEDDLTPAQKKKKIVAELFAKVYANLDGITIPDLSKAFGVSSRTGDRYLADCKSEKVENFENSSRITSRDKIIV